MFNYLWSFDVFILFGSAIYVYIRVIIVISYEWLTCPGHIFIWLGFCFFFLFFFLLFLDDLGVEPPNPPELAKARPFVTDLPNDEEA